MNKNKRIVCVGGGTGTFVVLSGLKKYCEPTAIVSMADSGGSTGRLRDEFGVLPPGDVRQALVALASEDTSQVLRELFSYRFDQPGSLYGHNFGNLFLTALSEVLGGEDKAIAEAGKLLGIHGRVLPVTLEGTQLLATYENGRELLGEKAIEAVPDDLNGRIKHLKLIPEVHIFDEARQAIQEAEIIVLGPGDLFTSLIPSLLVTGVREAIQESGAKLVYIVNLMTKRGQTDNFSACDHVTALESYTGRPFDFILLNNHEVPAKVRDFYAKESVSPVVDDLVGDGRVIRENLISQHLYEAVRGDTLKRGMLRHDSAKIARILLKLA